MTKATNKATSKTNTENTETNTEGKAVVNVPVIAPLTDAEKATLKTSKQNITKHLSSAFDCGKALYAISSGKLFRTQHETFKSMIAFEWDMSRPRAYQYMNAHLIKEILVKAGVKSGDLPKMESQVRPLSLFVSIDDASAIEADKITAVWERVVELKNASVTKKITAKLVTMAYTDVCITPLEDKDVTGKVDSNQGETEDVGKGDAEAMDIKSKGGNTEKPVVPTLKLQDDTPVAELPIDIAELQERVEFLKTQLDKAKATSDMLRVTNRKLVKDVQKKSKFKGSKLYTLLVKAGMKALTGTLQDEKEEAALVTLTSELLG